MAGILDHVFGCDGVLITHADGWMECTATGCEGGDVATHEWRMSCDDVDVECRACAPAAPSSRSRAA